jgi:hypothetical protein
VVGGELAILWIMVLRVEVGAISIRANKLCASVMWAKNLQDVNCTSGV